MYLKSITLKGFKSFPGRTRLEFAPGVSVIVGPNGSGKSNITDAVLWALGEQSPVAVRGQSMQDVIFGGTPGRQASGQAEVELVLDDSEGALGLGTPEVSIMRRLDRGGEGEYRLAGARCRLVDVIEVLSDTGLGKEMHSVISQGRVEALVTSKPRDRRMLIEEAAGLGKHRKRRRRAQLKLARTQENLDRALDVEREARSRLRPLKRQAEAAELHERLERQTLEAQWELARDEARAQLAALQEAQERVTTARQARAEVEREAAAVAGEREAAEEALAARGSRREELSRRVFAAQSAAERVGYRLEAVRAASATVGRRLERSRDAIGLLEAEAGAAAQATDPEAPQRIAALEESLAALARDREAELARQLAELERRLQDAAAATAAREAEIARRQVAREAAERALEQARAEVREAERGVEAARREAARVGGELAAVNQFLRSQASAPGGAPVLADELEVAPGYELALAAALDGRLRAALAGDVAQAGTLLDRAGADGGRALVPAATAADSGEAPSAPPVAGAQRLLDHVRGPAGALALAGLLLRDTWVVDALDGIPDSFRGVAVTCGGRVFAPATREMRQAPVGGEERVLAQRNRRDRLIAASERAVQAEVAARAALTAAGARAGESEAARERAVAEHRAAVRERDEAAEEQRRLAAQIERRREAPDDGPEAAQRLALEAELARERGALERAQREQQERTGRLARLRHGVVADEALLPAIEAVAVSLQGLADAIAARRAGFQEELTADRAAGEHLAARLRTCAQKEAALHTRLQRENEALTELEVRLQRVRDRLADTEGRLHAVAERLQLPAEPADQPLADDEVLALRTRLERLARRREQLGPVNPLAQQEYAEAVEHVEELERQRGDLETALRELQKLIADTDRQIRETFEQTFAAAAENFERVAAELFPGGRGRLRLVAEREGQARVLGAEAIAPDADAEGEEQELELEEDLLGVEIEITPAGKEMKRLSLLSGGEKSMTALAFLFAVFLARPCPFYILDEVEAALDDLNIGRFLELLRAYSTQAQFIVVTHQKRTMEAADTLYGVSMGADGISKVISRRLPREVAA
ncbi:MAG TPA: AAA family ATPase [Solirubrobacteraceae bacterium]|nr:AAA family ATPase [Solirubrobacteraceae bacterium]